MTTHRSAPVRPVGTAVHTGRPRIVVLGMMAKMPFAGVVWQTLHYLEGFRRLGCDVHYVEAHGSTPRDLIRDPNDDGGRAAATFLDRILGRFGFGSRWAYHARHSNEHLGRSRSETNALYGSADLILNLHGGTKPLPEHRATSRLALLCTDPVQLEIELFHGNQQTVEFVSQHDFHFTFGENYGTSDCTLPTSEAYQPLPTRQPVIMDFWPRRPPGAEAVFTTIGNWRQEVRDLRYRGETYTWSKHHEFLKLLELPRRTSAGLELALASITEEERTELVAHGWRVRDALGVSDEPERYRRYVVDSLGEFTVAKDQNVRFRTGWFSDRSACYLAAGRPVVTQDTGFGATLPAGDGLLSYRGIDDCVDALERVLTEPHRHSAAASEIAREFFSHDVVLPALLEATGIETDKTPGKRSVPSEPATRGGTIPNDLVLDPVARHPIILPSETVGRVMAGLSEGPPRASIRPEPLVSVVVVAHNQEVFTRLCLTSILANTRHSDVEVIVVDNASSDGTPAYLEGLCHRHPTVRVLTNQRNRGFAAANNQGLAAARGSTLVLLNNDTIVPPGWLGRLCRHLDDPSVGAVGPVTNRIGNEAQVDVRYRTYGQYTACASERARELEGRAFEIPTLTMFCFAMRRRTLERVGPLDERYGLGTLEDDDYSERLRKAGLRRLCAEDVLIHHFGGASFGALVPSGEYAALLERNRARFAAKWGHPWQPYGKRRSASYEALVDRIRTLVHEGVPEGACVGVVSRGDDALLGLGERRAWHLPSTPDGVYAGHHPADGNEALIALEKLVDRGAQYLVLPAPQAWWLEFYGPLRDWLDSHARVVAREAESCTIYRLPGDDPGVTCAPAASDTAEVEP
jgi:GT2 family glycosyltransferase